MGNNTGGKREAIFCYLDARPELTAEGLAKAFAPMSLVTARRWFRLHRETIHFRSGDRGVIVIDDRDHFSVSYRLC